MYATHRTCPMVIHSRAYIECLYQRTKKLWSEQSHKCDIEVKGQGRIGLMNVCDTSSYSDRRMCQIYLANVKSKK